MTQERSSGDRRALRIAHRGDWRAAPENSLAAVVAALLVPGIDGVEFDVRAAADGVPVLLHDETLERVQGRPERVDELTADELRDFGVPTLEAVLAAVPATTFLDVELKGDPGVERVVEVIEAGRGPAPGRPPEHVILSSFEPATLAAIRRARPGWPTWLNAEDLTLETIELAVAHGCVAVSAEQRSIERASIERARRAGLDVAAWTVTEPALLERLDELGVVAVCVEGNALEA